MTNFKLPVAMFALAGLFGTQAWADTGEAQVTRVFGSSLKDVARVTTSTPTAPARLRRTQNEQPGAEHSSVAMFSDNIHGLYFERRSGDINGTLPAASGGDNNDRVQGAMMPFHLAQNADGTVSAVADTTGAKFITSHQAENDRTFQVSRAMPINGGNMIAVIYAYREAGGGNRTKAWMQVYNAAGAQTMAETEIYSKSNDDCSMIQDGGGGVVARVTTTATGTVSHLALWNGCNGDGDDDGWLQVADVSCTADNTKCTFAEQFDVALCQQEERSRGYCSVSAADPDTAICSWTEGNNQPQRDGTWLAAVDITPGVKGNDLQKQIIWKQMMDGRKAATSDGTPATYSQRAMHERIVMPDATGALVATNQIIWRSGDAKGRNTDDEKAGTYYRNIMGVLQVDKTGVKPVVPLSDMQSKLLGLDGTHLGVGVGIFGTTDAPTPGLIFVGGSHTGGGYPAQATMVGFDQTAGTLTKLGDASTAPYDRHMYPNYLGQNPGNQGRNFSAMTMVTNPFVGQMGSKDRYLMIFANTGKDPSETANATNNDQCLPAGTTTGTPVPCASLKLSSYVTVLPIAQDPTTGGGTGSGSGSGSGSGVDGSGSDAAGPGTELGGCSTTGGTGGSVTFLLLGLAFIIRRRR